MRWGDAHTVCSEGWGGGLTMLHPDFARGVQRVGGDSGVSLAPPPIAALLFAMMKVMRHSQTAGWG